MVKKIFVLAVLLIAVFLLLRNFKDSGQLQDGAETVQEKIKDIAPVQSSNKRLLSFKMEGQDLLASWVEVTDPGKVRLYSNLEKNESARTLARKNQCTNLVNGSFYGKDKEHIGYFVTDGKTISKYEANKTFDGVFYITTDNLPYIKNIPTQENVRVALQSGPILLKEGMYRKFDIKNDDKERRMVLAITRKPSIIFISIYEKNSVFRGPYLASLPQVLEKIAAMIGENFSDAINLDGGTASAFITDEVALGEISSIGSYFCF